MWGELLARFLLGGTLVSGFAVLGQIFKPKTFGGLFGAAPSVALVSLAFGIAKRGPLGAAVEARSMVLGAVALAVYCALCVRLTLRRRPNLWIDTTAAWGAWLVAAFGLWWLRTRGLG